MWIEKHIIRPYLAFDSVLCEALQHNLPAMVPPPHHPSTAYPLPQVIFRMFDYTDCPEGPILPGQHSIERYLIEEQLKHILQVRNSTLNFKCRNKTEAFTRKFISVVPSKIFRLKIYALPI